MRAFRYACASALALSLLAGCGAGANGFAPPVAPSARRVDAVSKSKGTATLSVIVPRARRTRGRQPNYISPSSAKLLVAVNRGRPVTYGLTPQSPGCSLMQGNVACTFRIVAAPGRQALSLTIEDGAGAVLSRNVVSVKLAGGRETPVSVTLDGVPAQVIAVPGAGSAIEGTATPAYHVPGLVSEPIELEALDAAGNVIVGPGAPVIAQPKLTRGGKYARIVSAQTTDPNAYVLEPETGRIGGQIVTVSATARSLTLGNGRKGRPVTGATRFLFTPALVLASGRFVTEYSLETGNAIAAFNICAGGCPASFANGIASDADGDIWISYTSILGITISHIVEELPPGATTYSKVLGSDNGVTGAVAVATGAKDMLYVANAGSGFLTHHTPPSITEYKRRATSPTYTIDDANITDPVAIAVDKQGNVYLANEDGTIPVYPPGAAAAPSKTLSDPSLLAPSSMTIDRAGGLYVDDNDETNYVFDVAYFPPGSTTVGSTLTYPDFGDNAVALTMDPQGDLVASIANASETETFAAGALPQSLQLTSTLYAAGYPTWIP